MIYRKTCFRPWATQSAYSLAAEQAEDEVELNRMYEELDPRELMPTKYLALEEKHRGTETGLQSLVKVAEIARSVGDPDSNAAKGRVEAVKRRLKHYLHHEGLESIVATLGGGPFVPEADDFLQGLVEKSPYRKAQAEALIGQIIRGKETLTAESQLHAIRTSANERLSGATPEM